MGFMFGFSDLQIDTNRFQIQHIFHLYNMTPHLNKWDSHFYSGDLDGT